MKSVQLILQTSSRYYLRAINKPFQSVFPSFSFQIDSIFQWNSRNNNSSMPQLVDSLVMEGISNNTSLDSSKEENVFDMTFLFAAPKSKVISILLCNCMWNDFFDRFDRFPLQERDRSTLDTSQIRLRGSVAIVVENLSVLIVFALIKLRYVLWDQKNMKHIKQRMENQRKQWKPKKNRKVSFE